MTVDRARPTEISTGEGRRSRDWQVLAVALSAGFMSVFDLYVVNIALPALRTDLHASGAALQLVVAGYAFVYAAGLVTGGRLGDRFGYRRMFLVGMTAFTIASLGCALAPTSTLLVVARFVQGATASAMMPQVMSLITVTFPATRRAWATGWYGAFVGLGAIAGQILGGLLLQADLFGLGWRSIFLVNVPVGVVAVLVGRRLLPRPRTERAVRFDPVGAVAVSATVALVLIPLAVGRQEHWPAWTWACLVAAVPAGALAVVWQRALARRGGDPVIDPRLFGNRRYVLLLGAASLFQLYFGSFLFALTLLVQVRLGASPGEAALVFLPQGVLFTVASMFSGRLVARCRNRLPVLGAVLAVAGLIASAVQLLAAGGDLPGWSLAPALASVGLGNGLLYPPLLGAALTHVRPSQAGSASGTLNTAQQFASSLSVAVVGAAFFTLSGPSFANAGAAMELLDVLYVALVATIAGLATSAGRRP